MRFVLKADGIAKSVTIGASDMRITCRFARRGRIHVACLIAVGILAGIVAQTASANWTKVSSSPSTTQPYFACPATPKPGHASCQAIVDPTPETLIRGPLRAGTDRSAASPALEGGGVGGGFSPANLRSAYNLPSASAGSGQTVAIVDAYDDPNAEADLATYRSEYGIPECKSANGCFRKVNQTGGTSYPTPNTNWGEEISLDLDMVSAICPNCHILLVEATTNEFGNLLAAESEAASLGATEISNSWAGEEVASDTELNSYFTHPGVPIAAAAGDHGYQVNYPASSPDVIAVGGTTLTKASNSRGWAETVWYNNNGGEWVGTGSGCSAYEPKPAWQTDAGCVHRTNNDVAAVADENTPVSVYDSYGHSGEAAWRLIGGTSAATPIIASAMALANAYTRSFPGAEAFYMEALQNGTGALDDVVSGSNGSCGNYLCNARTGYDGPTGLGSPYGAPETLPMKASEVEWHGTRHVYYRGINGQLHEWYWNGTEWSQHDWGYTGEVAGDPSAVVLANGDIDVYYRATNGQLGQWWYGTKFLTEWSQHNWGYEKEIASDPSAIVLPNGSSDVYYRDSKGQLANWWFGTNQNTEWSQHNWGYENEIIGDPSAVSHSNNTIYVYYHSSSGQMGQWWYGTNQSTEWSQHNWGYEKEVASDPSAIVLPNGSTDVYYRSSSGQMGQWWYGTNPSSEWSQHNWGYEKEVAGTPSAVAHSNNTIDVYYRTTNAQLGQWWYGTNQSSEWNQHDWGYAGALGGDPSAGGIASGGEDIYYGGTNSQMWQWWIDGSSWNLSAVGSW
jgi:hypothetical protein